MAPPKKIQQAPIEITIPYKFKPREYQIPFLRAMDSGCKRAFKLWHRRAGKDKTDLNFTIKSMFPESPYGRIGTYFHLFPTYAQGKKVIWDGIDASGQRVLDHFPRPLIADMNETELQIRLINGSVYQIIGTDKPDSVVGTNPVGLVYSEFSLQNPTVSDYLDPILAENGGWAVYNTTPRGHNHAKALYESVVNNPKWFCERLTILDTKREDGSPVIRMEEIEELRRKGVREDFIQQEYFCSFEGFQEGSIYGKEMIAAEKENRITEVPWDPRLPVFTFWDLGYGDATAIWFVQRQGNKICVIDFYQNSGVGVRHYAKKLNNELSYSYIRHYWPHDGRHGEFGTGDTKMDTGENQGLRPIESLKRGPIDDGIEAVRNLLPRCWFDRRCAQGIKALQDYRYEYDNDRQEYKAKPFHNWCSNPADAFRTMAMSDWEKVALDGYRDKIRVETSFNPHETKDYGISVESDFDVGQAFGR